MSAQPIHEEPDPQDPLVIHDRLPEAARAKFLAEYEAAAVDAAHDLTRYRALQELLQTWRILAAAYDNPDFHSRYQDITAGVGEYVSMSEVVPHPPA
jgi:hypothetical protein